MPLTLDNIDDTDYDCETVPNE